MLPLWCKCGGHIQLRRDATYEQVYIARTARVNDGARPALRKQSCALFPPLALSIYCTDGSAGKRDSTTRARHAPRALRTQNQHRRRPRGLGPSFFFWRRLKSATCSFFLMHAGIPTQGETDAPPSGTRSVDTRPDSRPRPLVACSALLANGCLSTGSTEGVYTDALRREHEKTVPRFPGAFAVLHVVVCC